MSMGSDLWVLADLNDVTLLDDEDTNSILADEDNRALGKVSN